MSRAPIHVVLYEKADCGLCAEAHRALMRLRAKLALDVERIDIAGDDALLERYALRIPVLRRGDAELDAAGLDEAALRRWLTELKRSVG